MGDWLTETFGDDGLSRRTGIGRFARQHLVDDASQAVLIASGIEPWAGARLLRTHICRGAQRESGFRQPFPSSARCRERYTEIRHHRLALIEQDVLRLDVPMDHPTLVGVLQCRSDCPGNLQCVIGRKLALSAEPFSQSLSFY